MKSERAFMHKYQHFQTITLPLIILEAYRLLPFEQVGAYTGPL